MVVRPRPPTICLQDDGTIRVISRSGRSVTVNPGGRFIDDKLYDCLMQTCVEAPRFTMVKLFVKALAKRDIGLAWHVLRGK